MKNQDQGVVYLATGEKYYREAVVSAESLKRHNPDLGVTIFTDQDRGAGCFDNHEIIGSPLFTNGDKTRHIARSPYSNSLFLDSDTFVTGDLSEFFSILERFDFAAVHAVARGHWYSQEYRPHGIPDSFSEVNSGVFSFRKCDATEKLFHDWAMIYREETSPGGWLHSTDKQWDQPSLRRALWRNPEVRLCILPTEFNALRNWGTFLWSRARVVHGRGAIERIAGEMNEGSDVERVYLQQFGMMPRMESVSLWRTCRIWLRFHAALFLVLLRRVKRK